MVEDQGVDPKRWTAACWPRLRTHRLWWCTNEHSASNRTKQQVARTFRHVAAAGSGKRRRRRASSQSSRRSPPSATPGSCRDAHSGGMGHPNVTPLNASAIQRCSLDMGGTSSRAPCGSVDNAVGRNSHAQCGVRDEVASSPMSDATGRRSAGCVRCARRRTSSPKTCGSQDGSNGKE